MSNIERSEGYWTVENLTARLAERSNQLLSARDKIDTLTDEVEYLDQQLRGAVEALRDLLAAYDRAYPKGGQRLPGPSLYVATEKARHYLNGGQ
jgi:malate synthase